MPTAPEAEPVPVSDDDSVSVETDPFDDPGLTQECLDYYQRVHEERVAQGMYAGRQLFPPPPDPPPKRRTRHMLVGLANPYPDHGLKRSPTGRVRSWRLETQRKRDTAASKAAAKGHPRERARSKASRKGAKGRQAKKKAAPRRRKPGSAKSTS